MLLRELMSEARRKIAASGSDSAGADARYLAETALGRSLEWLLVHDDYELSPVERARFDAMVARRCQGEPVAYITGRRGFWSLELACNSSTLIPRPDTETLVEAALAAAPRNGRVHDLATGTGAVALALKKERPDLAVSGSDVAPEAVELARFNAAENRLDVDFFVSSWFERVTERFDLITANPPYIAAGDEHLAQGDVRFEPRGALVAGDNGLADLKFIIAHAPEYLLPGGRLLLEHGYDQKEPVQSFFSQHGYAEVATLKDLGGNFRVTCGTRK